MLFAAVNEKASAVLQYRMKFVARNAKKTIDAYLEKFNLELNFFYIIF